MRFHSKLREFLKNDQVIIPFYLLGREIIRFSKNSFRLRSFKNINTNYMDGTYTTLLLYISTISRPSSDHFVDTKYQSYESYHIQLGVKFRMNWKD